MTEAWTCSRCERVRDWSTEPPGGQRDWRILAVTTGQVVCPDCLTEDDIVDNRHADFYFDESAGIFRIACRCGSDLGPTPETKPTDIECLSCGAVWTVYGEIGSALKAKSLPPIEPLG